MAKVLCVISSDTNRTDLPIKMDDSVEVTYVENCRSALDTLRTDDFDGIYYGGGESGTPSVGSLIQNVEIMDWIPHGLAILDHRNIILRANPRLVSWFKNPEMTGLNFYEAIGQPQILGPEPSPLAFAKSKLKPCRATLSVDGRYFMLSVVPIIADTGKCMETLVTLCDTTESVTQRQKLEALHQAGTALADLRPEEIYLMDVEQRTDLLKDNILHYTKDLLDFDVIEIRLVDSESGLLNPLLSVGIDSQVASQPLYARAAGNGVTGFVTATGKSYLCEDTTDDPLYLDGLIGAKSSLTVPLVYHEQVIGSFNVESPEVGAFSESDLHFLESFARDIAVALNTLELLNAQRTDAALESVSAIHCAVAMPIDEILNDTVNAIECLSGKDPTVANRLRTILKHARLVKKAIQEVGNELAPTDGVPTAVHTEIRPALKDKRILVIDADEEIRNSAHRMLERFGCDVETAHEGEEAILMVRNSDQENGYDAIIADIRLPDIGGFELLIRLKEIIPEPHLILMTGFGYDPGHAIVKARQAGLKANAVLFKPFRIDQLVEVVESMV